MEVLQRTANRGSIATAAYEIENSCKFEQDNSEAMTRTATASQGGNRKTWTWSGWIKRTELGRHMYLFSAGGTGFQILGADNIRFSLYYNNTSYYLDLNAKLRDTSAWYHIVGQLDTTQSTAQDRVKVWINGERQTSFSNDSAHNISQNADVQHLNEATGTSTGWMKICDWYASGRFFSGYAAEWHFTDGVANDPTEFGEFDTTSGIWKPKEYDGSYGTNGFYLDFADGADLGDDESGNGNDFSEGNLTAADQATDTPTNNFCTFNPSMDQGNSPTITEGAMKSTGGGGSFNQTWGTIGTKSGKWYYEMKVTNTSYTGYFGASTTPAVSDYTNTVQLMYNTSFIVGTANGIDYYYWQNGSQTSNESTGWGNLVNNDVLGLALDLDASTKKFYLYKNGSLLNSGGTNLPTNMQDEFIFPLYVQYENRQDEINFGGYTISSISSAASDANGYGTFEYAPPSGYYALCTKNLAQYGG